MFIVILVALFGIVSIAAAKADVVVRPCWVAEQEDSQTFWYYYWHGQKYHVDPKGQHWAITATTCDPVDNRFVPCMGGPVRQMAASFCGRLANAADRMRAP
jgi:hypothetical protein